MADNDNTPASIDLALLGLQEADASKLVKVRENLAQALADVWSDNLPETLDQLVDKINDQHEHPPNYIGRILDNWLAYEYSRSKFSETQKLQIIQLIGETLLKAYQQTLKDCAQIIPNNLVNEDAQRIIKKYALNYLENVTPGVQTASIDIRKLWWQRAIVWAILFELDRRMREEALKRHIANIEGFHAEQYVKAYFERDAELAKLRLQEAFELERNLQLSEIENIAKQDDILNAATRRYLDEKQAWVSGLIQQNEKEIKELKLYIEETQDKITKLEADIEHYHQAINAHDVEIESIEESLNFVVKNRENLEQLLEDERQSLREQGVRFEAVENEQGETEYVVRVDPDQVHKQAQHKDRLLRRASLRNMRKRGARIFNQEELDDLHAQTKKDIDMIEGIDPEVKEKYKAMIDAKRDLESSENTVLLAKIKDVNNVIDASLAQCTFTEVYKLNLLLEKHPDMAPIIQPILEKLMSHPEVMKSMQDYGVSDIKSFQALYEIMRRIESEFVVDYLKDAQGRFIDLDGNLVDDQNKVMGLRYKISDKTPREQHDEIAIILQSRLDEATSNKGYAFNLDAQTLINNHLIARDKQRQFALQDPGHFEKMRGLEREIEQVNRELLSIKSNTKNKKKKKKRQALMERQKELMIEMASLAKVRQEQHKAAPIPIDEAFTNAAIKKPDDFLSLREHLKQGRKEIKQYKKDKYNPIRDRYEKLNDEYFALLMDKEFKALEEKGELFLKDQIAIQDEIFLLRASERTLATQLEHKLHDKQALVDTCDNAEQELTQLKRSLSEAQQQVHQKEQLNDTLIEYNMLIADINDMFEEQQKASREVEACLKMIEAFEHESDGPQVRVKSESEREAAIRQLQDKYEIAHRKKLEIRQNVAVNIQRLEFLEEKIKLLQQAKVDIHVEPELDHRQTLRERMRKGIAQARTIRKQAFVRDTFEHTTDHQKTHTMDAKPPEQAATPKDQPREWVTAGAKREANPFPGMMKHAQNSPNLIRDGFDLIHDTEKLGELAVEFRKIRNGKAHNPNNVFWKIYQNNEMLAEMIDKLNEEEERLEGLMTAHERGLAPANYDNDENVAKLENLQAYRAVLIEKQLADNELINTVLAIAAYHKEIKSAEEKMAKYEKRMSGDYKKDSRVAQRYKEESKVQKYYRERHEHVSVQKKMKEKAMSRQHADLKDQFAKVNHLDRQAERCKKLMEAPLASKKQKTITHMRQQTTGVDLKFGLHRESDDIKRKRAEALAQHQQTKGK